LAFSSAIYRRWGALYDVRRLGCAAVPPASDGVLTGVAGDRPVRRRARDRELAAGGRSNLESARAGRSARRPSRSTLGAAYQKLGVSSRTQLAPLVSMNGAR
jgi:DNA-binding CsgD family transcriptional regulator